MPESGDRDRLSRTFDRAAALYQRARPDYPEELFEHLLAVTGLRPPARLLEVGCGTGKATLPLARRGFAITCLEPGPALAAVARANLGDAEVINTRFEDWSAADRFPMLFSATAWHWLDPAIRYQRAADVLEPRGWLATWSATHVFPEDGDPFFAELQEVYEEIGEADPPGTPRPRPGELPEQSAEIEASGLFEVVDVRQFDWETVHDAERYIDLLNTFSGHIAMADRQRDRLYGEIRSRLARRPDGLLRRHWGCVLHVARRTGIGGSR